MDLYYKQLCTINDISSLKRRTTYIIKRSENDIGVSNPCIKKYREDVLRYLGKKAFEYLEQNLDARDYTWRVSSPFNWGILERAGMTRSYTKSITGRKKA